LRGQSIRPSSVISREGDYQAPGFESSEQLVERARRQVDASEFLDVFHEGVSVLIAPRQTGKNEYRRRGVSSQPRKGVIVSDHLRTISISDISVNDIVPLLAVPSIRAHVPGLKAGAPS
jgi:hypothetical protein